MIPLNPRLINPLVYDAIVPIVSISDGRVDFLKTGSAPFINPLELVEDGPLEGLVPVFGVVVCVFPDGVVVVVFEDPVLPLRSCPEPADPSACNFPWKISSAC